MKRDHKQILDDIIDSLSYDIDHIPSNSEGEIDLKIKCQVVDTLAKVVRLRREIDKDEAKESEPKQLSWLDTLPNAPNVN